MPTPEVDMSFYIDPGSSNRELEWFASEESERANDIYQDLIKSDLLQADHEYGVAYIQAFESAQTEDKRLSLRIGTEMVIARLREEGKMHSDFDTVEQAWRLINMHPNEIGEAIRDFTRELEDIAHGLGDEVGVLGIEPSVSTSRT